MSRFRAFTTSLGFRVSNDIRRSSTDQFSIHQPPDTMSLRPQDGNFTLYLRVHSARKLNTVAQGSYCKLYIGDTSIVGGFGQWKSLVRFQKSQGDRHRTFHTKVQLSASRDCLEWNEKFEISVSNPNVEILTIRVKNHVAIYSPAIGACVVQMHHLRLGQTSDAWYPLYNGNKRSGDIRLQIRLQKNVVLQRLSQGCEATVERLMRQHRELVETQRREEMTMNGKNQVRLKQYQNSEEDWRERCARKLQQEQLLENYDDSMLNSEADLKVRAENDLKSGLLPSFKYRDVIKKEHVVTQEMKDMSLQTIAERNTESVGRFDALNGYTVANTDFRNTTEGCSSQQAFKIGTNQLSTEDLHQVVQNALPTSDSSESSSSRDRYCRQRNRRKKREGDVRKHRNERQTTYSDEISDESAQSLSKENSMFFDNRYRNKHQSRKGSIMDSDQPNECIETSFQEDHFRRGRIQAKKLEGRETKTKSRDKRMSRSGEKGYLSSSSMSSSEEERELTWRVT
ncbi:C2 domain [Plasmopara halstedii]|uniref:C2 domain n=1 Tax=Plasmopara halstedii TaxID=4781 RepID=A0A0P1AIK2_PLAHL|nr:C2 domain [Plasmopara halstedii]CEG41030.1 C2 domain [Plasmopara halstedii]|eukprot:XP_024577399.1 C2 domain [Plasmopara halstedii]